MLLVALAGCIDFGSKPPPPPPPADASEVGDGGAIVNVSIAALRFTPTTLTVRPGTTVRWTNYDAVQHTVTEGNPGASGTPLFDSPMLGTGDHFSYRFNQAGSWSYYCRTHPSVMKGNQVNVQ